MVGARVTYWVWLAGISLLFLVAERLRPARPGQPVLRRQWGNDLFYLVFNGHLYALLAGGIAGAVALRTREALGPWLPFAGAGEGLSALPAWGQFAVYLLVSDLLQWGVHNLLHRVPLLWQFHKVHHSIHQMDWIGNFRFHWVELVVYRSLLYVPLALLGGDASPLLAVAVFATAWGHFNHANLDLGLGPAGLPLQQPAHAPVAPRRLGRGRRVQELRHRAVAVGLALRHGLLAARPGARAHRLPRRRRAPARRAAPGAVPADTGAVGARLRGNRVSGIGAGA